jgi:hypothetical protein
MLIGHPGPATFCRGTSVMLPWLGTKGLPMHPEECLENVLAAEADPAVPTTAISAKQIYAPDFLNGRRVDRSGWVISGDQPPRCFLQAPFRLLKSNGSDRSRLPVAAKIPWGTAGAIGGTPRSPTSVGFSFEGTM